MPDQIRQFLPNPFATLGADGHGFSDTRAAARRFFHIDVALHRGPGAADARRRRRGRRVTATREAAEKYQLLDVNAGTTGNAGGDS